jgi:hypothetical protein
MHNFLSASRFVFFDSNNAGKLCPAWDKNQIVFAKMSRRAREAVPTAQGMAARRG